MKSLLHSNSLDVIKKKLFLLMKMLHNQDKKFKHKIYFSAEISPLCKWQMYNKKFCNKDDPVEKHHLIINSNN